MINFIGHIQARLDSKGRLLFPSIFKKNLTSSNKDSFVIKKDIWEDCLLLYPMDVWEEESKHLQKTLNPYNREHNRFLRRFFSDTAQINLDSNNRLLIPKRLLEIAEIDRDVILLGVGNKIEIWSPQKLEYQNISEEEYTQLAEKILKDFNQKDE